VRIDQLAGPPRARSRVHVSSICPSSACSIARRRCCAPWSPAWS